LFHGRGSGGDSQPELVRDHGVIVWRVEGDRGVTLRHPAGFVLRGSWGIHVGQSWAKRFSCHETCLWV
jgi:hypothetical protein